MNGINLEQIPVGISDFLIALISLSMAYYFKRLSIKNSFSTLWGWYFFLVALVSFFGGFYHLLTPGILKPPLSSLLWYLILLFLGFVSIIGWRLFCLMGWHTIFEKRPSTIEMIVFLIYGLVIFKYPYFIVASLLLGFMAICHVFLGLIKCLQSFSFHWFFYMLGWIAYLVGALIQFLGISWDAMLLSNNTLYHLISAIAIYMIFKSIKKLIIEDKF